MSAAPPRFQLFVRQDCELCSELHAMLDEDRRVTTAGLLLIDIETSPALLMRYTYRVPVLVFGEHEICCGRVAREELSTALDTLFVGN